MTQHTRFTPAACLALGLTCGFIAAAGAQNFPAKPVRIVVGLAPGGGTDIVARHVGQKLSPAIGQQVVIDNRPGASGNIAAELVARSPADGYTLIVVTASHAVNPSLYKKLSYDPIKDFSPITQLTSQPYIFVVHPSLPVKNVKEYIALSKTRKGGLTYASSGSGLLGHLGMELLKTMGKFEGTHIPYKGANPALVDTISGQVEAFFPTIISGLPQVKAKKVRAIAVTTVQRSPLLPDVPTVAEQGFAGTGCSRRPAHRRKSSPTSTPRWRRPSSSPISPGACRPTARCRSATPRTSSEPTSSPK
jgi:tripartite-type tricarboxylate transporter receptor subunit TctC